MCYATQIILSRLFFLALMISIRFYLFLTGALLSQFQEMSQRVH